MSEKSGQRRLSARDYKAVTETEKARKAERDAERELVRQARAERAIKTSPVPTKRRQPKIRRHQSPRQRIAESQTKFWLKAGSMTALDAEMGWNATPTIDPEKAELTNSPQEDGPNGYRAGKPTGATPVGYNKVEYRKRTYRKPLEPGSYGGRRQVQPKIDIAKLAEQYDSD